MAAGKPKLAMYWAASCGGCEIALANIHEALLEVDAHFDFMFCPCLLDTKRHHIEALEDGEIFLTLFNGALRTTENLEMAELLRRKSRLLVAFGSCAAHGGIPALANARGLQDVLETSYLKAPGLHNPDGIIPSPCTAVPDGELYLPAFLDRVKPLSGAVEVDYTLPGCPPEPEQILAVVRHVASGAALPPAAPCWAARTARSATNAGSRKGASWRNASCAPSRPYLNPAGASWNRGSCAWGTPPGAAARPSAPPWRCPAPAATAPLTRMAIRAPWRWLGWLRPWRPARPREKTKQPFTPACGRPCPAWPIPSAPSTAMPWPIR